MLNLKEIEEEIAKLKCGDTTYKACERLAILTMARDELKAGEEPEKIEQKYSSYSFRSESEFSELARRVPGDLLIEIMDSHMGAIKIVYPKEYSLIINKLKNA